MYARQDMTAEDAEHDRVITSPEYQAGLEQGYRLALAIHGIKED